MKRKNKISRFARYVIALMLPGYSDDTVIGDYEELYLRKLLTAGRLKAFLWLWLQILKTFIPFIKYSIEWGVIMVFNYLKNGLRYLLKNKIYSFINITGFAVGIASCFLIFLYIKAEITVDAYHEKADNIYQVTSWLSIGSNEFYSNSTNAVIGPALRTDYPEVETAVRFRNMDGVSVRYGDKEFNEYGIRYTDKTVFDVFTWPALKGDLSTALERPNTIVITEDFAEKYFGSEDPIGKTLIFNKTQNIQVTAVIENIPENSIFNFPALCSFKTFETPETRDNVIFTDWNSHNFRTYALLKNNADISNLEMKMDKLLQEKSGESLKQSGMKKNYHMHKFRDMYLRPPGVTSAPITYVYIFSIVTIVVLLMACMNFINLSTARSIKRAREVAVRKVLGAFKYRLIIQFMTESVLTSIIAFIFSIGLIYLFIPAINEISGRNFYELISNPLFYFSGLFIFTFLVGVVSGFYPSLVLSSFKPAKILRANSGKSSSKSNLRSVLLVVQFVISISLIFCTTIIVKQIDFMKNKDAGFDKEQLLVARMPAESIKKSVDALRTEFSNLPWVSSVSFSSTIPSWGSASNTKIPEGFEESQSQLMDEFNVGHNFIKTMGMKLVAGRNFSDEFPTDNNEAVIINEAAARKFGWENPVGKIIKTRENENSEEYNLRKVIGVIEDFHLRSVVGEIQPLFMISDPDFPFSYNDLRVVALRLQPENMIETIDGIKTKWAEIFNNKELDYSFMNEVFNRQFRRYEISKKLLSYFTTLAIIIACLGLVGMASFLAENRTKEIGIRKAIGADTFSIVKLFVNDFLKWILLACVIALPAAAYTMTGWLENFAYRTELTIWIFILTFVIAVGISVATVVFQVLRASMARPVDSLKYE